MKSLMFLFDEVLHEMGTWCRVSTDMDIKNVHARVKDEGVSFLTISLSNFGKDFEKSLDQGYVDRNQFNGFRFSGGLPLLFGGFLDLVFDRKNGLLHDMPSIDAIRGLRQISLMWSKIALDCSESRISSAIDKYIMCEQDVKSYDRTFPLRSEEFGRVSMLLWANLFSSVDSDIYMNRILPKHGPGATADKLYGNAKWSQLQWPSRLDSIFPYGEHVVTSWTHYLSIEDSVDILEPGSEIPVKVITVPKTLKTPRIIAVEPTCMQYMQQGILRSIVENIERDTNAFNFIRFKYQTPNQDLALIGSLSGELATLDLSEASDRVSNQHVRTMLAHFPHFAEAVDATRSRKADVPGHGVIRLAKFASMGSALCFPMEALVFTTIVFLGIQNALNRPLTNKDIKSFFGKVRVYGDDIIVPVEYARSVVDCLESFGLKVNQSKSFWTGKFRESCGKDYYDGHDVSVTRVRRMIPTQRQQTDEIVSAVSLRNQLFKRGFFATCKYLDGIIESLIPFPLGCETSPGLVKVEFGNFVPERHSETLHIPLVKAMVVTVKPRPSVVDGWAALSKYFHKDSELPFADRKHLMFAGRPLAVNITQRWISPY